MKYPRGNIVVIDTETSGLNAFNNGVLDKKGNLPGARIFCFAYFTELGEYGFMMKTSRSLAWLKRLLNDKRKTVVFQNAKFDLELLYFEGFDVLNLKAHIDDTMIMSKVVRSTAPAHDLITLSKQVLGKYDTDDKDEIVIWLKEHGNEFKKLHGRKPNFSDVPIEIVKRRVLWDVETTFYVYSKLKSMVEETCPELYETERRLIFACIDLELYGVKIDISRAKELRAQAIKDLTAIQNDLDKLVLPIQVTRKKKGIEIVEQITDKFNPGSGQHVAGAFNKLGIPLLYKTKPKKSKKGSDKKSGGGNWSFDEYAMIRYVSKPLAGVIRDSGEDGWPASKFYDEVYRVIEEYDLDEQELLPPLILKYRQVQKMISTYYDHLINDCTDTHVESSGREVGILHCKFNAQECMTGRFSSSQINLQNIPRLLGPRECFIPRKGRRNYHLDYDQVEMRFFVHFSGDQTMAAAIDEDIHRTVAAEIYDKPKEEVTSEQRKRAKGTNFGIIYGAGAATIAETLTKKGLPTSTQEGMQVTGKYHRKFPSVRRTTKAFGSELKEYGYVTNPFGRRYHIPTQFSYKMLNYMCQGTSADLMKRAMVEVWEWLRATNKISRIILTVHDEIVLECPRTEELEVVTKAIEIMEELEMFNIPMTVSVDVVTKRWSEKVKPSSLGFSFK